MYKGFTKAWRRELDSDLWLMPPIYHRVWYCLRQKVQHEKFLFPTNKKYGVWVLPGQRVTSYQEIAEWCKWSEWGREKIPNKKTIKSVLDYLKQEGMITAEGNARGTLISIVKWSTYNNIDSGKGNGQVTPAGYKKRMLKNEENKEEDKEPKPIVVKHDVVEVIDFLNSTTGSKYRHSTKATVAIITARINEGFTVEDIKSVITKKAKEWKGTKYEKYLQPSTLFSPTKFEGYLNQRGENTGQKIVKTPEQLAREEILRNVETYT